MTFSELNETILSNGMKRRDFDYPDQDTSIEALFLGGTVQDMPEAADKVDPANYITKDCPCFLLLHGFTDPVALHQQSVAIAETIKKKAGQEKVTLRLYPETKHDNGHYDDPEVFEEVLHFLDRHMRNI